jgi:hypothetical protein
MLKSYRFYSAFGKVSTASGYVVEAEYFVLGNLHSDTQTTGNFLTAGVNINSSARTVISGANVASPDSFLISGYNDLFATNLE